MRPSWFRTNGKLSALEAGTPEYSTGTALRDPLSVLPVCAIVRRMPSTHPNAGAGGSAVAWILFNLEWRVWQGIPRHFAARVLLPSHKIIALKISSRSTSARLRTARCGAQLSR